ncbi:MAG: chorismate mutase [Candidatus Gracilibacteria bacterium]|nr:chorismate mutase [Candidatus Gracilibacteria bacterium]
MEFEALFKNYREQIDTLDKELLYLFHRRFEIVKEIGKLKKENSVETLQADRWKKLLTENILVGEELGLSEDFVIDIWERIHKESLKLEK